MRTSIRFTGSGPSIHPSVWLSALSLLLSLQLPAGSVLARSAPAEGFRIAQSYELSDSYWQQAKALLDQDKFLEAAKMYEKSYEAERASPRPRQKGLAYQRGQAGYCYGQIQQYDKALDYMQQAAALFAQLGSKDQQALQLNRMAGIYQRLGQHQQALDHYQQVLTINQGLGEEKYVAVTLSNIGYTYSGWGKYEQALGFYQQSLAMNKKADRKENIAIDLNNIGGLYDSWGQYERALSYYEQALDLDRKLGHEADSAIRLNNIALVRLSLGQYDKAVDAYQQSLVITRRLGISDQQAIALSGTGGVYKAWGQPQKALDFYQQALAIDKRTGQQEGIATELNNIGGVYFENQDYDKALDAYQQALALDQQGQRDQAIAIDLSNIANVHRIRGHYEQALEVYQQALAIDRKLGQTADIASVHNNLGYLYYWWGQYDKALEHHQQALELEQKLGREAEIAVNLNNIGNVYFSSGRYDQAIDVFQRSIALKEKIRKTAQGEVRRDYLASQRYTYQTLIASFVKKRDFAQAYQTIELSRAKLLVETLAGSDQIAIPTLKQVQSELPAQTGVLIFANAELENGVQLTITPQAALGQEVSNAAFLAAGGQKFQVPLKALIDKQRGIRIKPTQENVAPQQQERQADFARLIHYYRSLLTNPDPALAKDTRELAHMLYQLLVKPSQSALKGKTELLIVADDVLNFIPFESLIDDQGKYLAETYQIRYIQSLSVLAQVQKRQYAAGRKPLLALGGAIYDQGKYAAEMTLNPAQFSALEKQVMALGRGSAQQAYQALGISGWPNLPGTLAEVNAIGKILPGAEILTGDQVSESQIKALSTSGRLAQYQRLHFATHGLVVPGLPELSALVLSQFAPEKDGQDGYLRMQEIAGLKLKADFVNLSACETGLGQLYGGEGVVGLTQAFLLAGANGLSVSLWQVADDSTAQFMVGMYQALEKDKLGYAEVMTRMKRRFIKGDFGETYRHPYYWAPFVYYGKS
ncbi:MAG: tetratricopeptide repeat protein [Candidatus Sericytochromatia bacterium]